MPADAKCERELASYFFGAGNRQGFGLPYLLAALRQSALKATFFVDPLFSFALGAAPLREVLALILDHDQEVGLHLHPEWLTDERCRGLPRFRGPLLWQYPDAEQSVLIRAGLDRLAELGATDVRAFRAGSWAADLSTLHALAANGVSFDSSLNPCFDASFPSLESRHRLAQPVRVNGVWEFPVTRIVDRPPSGTRPLHVCACSLEEFQAALAGAHSASWYAAVVVLHSFEFARVDRLAKGKAVTPQRWLVRRFNALCEYLSGNRERFETCHFRDLDPGAVLEHGPAQPLVSSRPRTYRRYAAQLLSRIY